MLAMEEAGVDRRHSRSSSEALPLTDSCYSLRGTLQPRAVLGYGIPVRRSWAYSWQRCSSSSASCGGRARSKPRAAGGGQRPHQGGTVGFKALLERSPPEQRTTTIYRYHYPSQGRFPIPEGRDIDTWRACLILSVLQAEDRIGFEMAERSSDEPFTRKNFLSHLVKSSVSRTMR